MKNFIFKIDHWVAKMFHEIYLWGGEFSNSVMEGISLIAEAGILFLLVGFGLALFKRTRKIGGTILGAVAIGFILTNVVLKNLFERARPFENIYSDFFGWWLSAGAINEGGFSFPSGHTTATTAFAVAIFLTTNKKYSWPILLLPLLMASSRIYLMAHYFSDCVGGIIVGTIAATLSYLIVKWIYKSNIKFFVWLKEFNIFKTRQKTKAPKTSSTEENSSDYVYTTQADEQASANQEIEQNDEKGAQSTSDDKQ